MTARNQAIPIYQYFLGIVLKLKARFVSIIIPSRWFASGMKSLEPFREQMTYDKHIKYLRDFIDSKKCFANTSISGGVCIVLRDSAHIGDCTFSDYSGNIMQRSLNEFEVLVRYNKAVNILHKILKQNFIPLSKITSPACPFGLPTNMRGRDQKNTIDCLTLYSSTDKTYISRPEVKNGYSLIDKYKVMIGKMASEHAGEPSKTDGKYRVFTNAMRVLFPGEVVTHSYFCCGCFGNQLEAENLCAYLKSCFVRFLVLISLTATNLSQKNFIFVPNQDFSDNSDIDWQQDIDSQLYKKYGITKDEVSFIKSIIKPSSPAQLNHKVNKRLD